MNYYGPRDIKDKDGHATGRYHYTCQNDDQVWPVGNCAAGCPGHDTMDGAFEHQREWEIDHIRLDGTSSHWMPCEACGELTNRFATWGTGGMGPTRYLCDAHRTQEYVAPHVKVGYVTSSF